MSRSPPSGGFAKYKSVCKPNSKMYNSCQCEQSYANTAKATSAPPNRRANAPRHSPLASQFALQAAVSLASAVSIALTSTTTGSTSTNNKMSDDLTRLRPAQTITVGGVNINYDSNIITNAPFCVVLIHGFAASLETWYDIYPLLSRHYSTIRLDLKGSGFSDKPKDGHYAPADQALLLRQFLSRLGQTNVVLVGHSLGGAVALLTYFACKASNRVISIKGLVLVDSAAYPQDLPFFVSAMRNPLTSLASSFMPPDDRARYVLDKIIKVKREITPERVCRYSYFLDMPGSRYALSQTADQIIPNNSGELTAKLPTITTPTLIIWGEDDPVIPVENARRFHNDIPSSSLVLLPATGHIPQEERPMHTFRILDDFLKSLK